MEPTCVGVGVLGREEAEAKMAEAMGKTEETRRERAALIIQVGQKGVGQPGHDPLLFWTVSEAFWSSLVRQGFHVRALTFQINLYRPYKARRRIREVCCRRYKKLFDPKTHQAYYYNTR